MYKTRNFEYEKYIHSAEWRKVAVIRPVKGFHSLSKEDYTKLNAVADYMMSVSGNGVFKGGY